MNSEIARAKLLRLIEAEIKTYEPYDVLSFVQGMESASRLFGTWKDGQQWLGIGEYTVHDMVAAIHKFIEVQK